MDEVELTAQDENPIQTIHLGPGASLVHTYEESQVQGSWKIVSSSAHGSEVSRVAVDKHETVCVCIVG
jgi:hypothetical protein